MCDSGKRVVIDGADARAGKFELLSGDPSGIPRRDHSSCSRGNLVLAVDFDRTFAKLLPNKSKSFRGEALCIRSVILF